MFLLCCHVLHFTEPIYVELIQNNNNNNYEPASVFAFFKGVSVVFLFVAGSFYNHLSGNFTEHFCNLWTTGDGEACWYCPLSESRNK